MNYFQVSIFYKLIKKNYNTFIFFPLNDNYCSLIKNHFIQIDQYTVKKYELKEKKYHLSEEGLNKMKK